MSQRTLPCLRSDHRPRLLSRPSPNPVHDLSADHSATGGVYDGANPVKNGLVVDGDDVTTYGLAVEHTLEDLTVWNGEGGQVFFYQSELPYDVDQVS